MNYYPKEGGDKSPLRGSESSTGKWIVGANLDMSPIGPISNQIKRGQLMFPTGRHPDISYSPQWWRRLI
jgi:hypothetical protein